MTNSGASIPHAETRLALEDLTDRTAFQTLCDELLSAEFAYKLHPRGMNARGTVPGQPDSYGTDAMGNTCALSYSTAADWQTKLDEDLESAAKLQAEGFSPTVFVYCTNRHIDATVERRLQREVKDSYGWELRLFGQNEFAVPLDTKWHDVRERHLGIKLERHNWPSLLAACEQQRERILAWYQDKYEPELYVRRVLESDIDSWYRGALRSLRSETKAQPLFAVVDEAGAGKSTLVLYIAETYGNSAPVIVIRGTLTILDEHTLEREICAAIGYPIEGRHFQADLDSLFSLTEHEACPLLVVLDGINENTQPIAMRNALLQLLSTAEGRPLLILLTCRDVLWTYYRDPRLQRFAHRPEAPTSEEFAFPLGQFNEDEATEALSRYLQHFDVDAALGRDAAAQLRSPLLLRIFSEVNAGRTLGGVQRVDALATWDAWRRRKVRDVFDAAEQALTEQAIGSALEDLSLRMFERNSPVLTVSDASALPYLDPDSMQPSSLLLRFRDAGILRYTDDNQVAFLHEPFMEFVLACALSRSVELDSASAATKIERLATTPRWRPVALLLCELTTRPDDIIETFQESNPRLAAEALLRVGNRASSSTRDTAVAWLVEQVASRFELDRRRACELLGSLRAPEGRDALITEWQVNHSLAAMHALARLGQQLVIDPLILQLGRHEDLYWSEYQALIDELTETYRRQVTHRAVEMLSLPQHARAAAHALGYFRDEACLRPLADYAISHPEHSGNALATILRVRSASTAATLERALEGLTAALEDMESKQRECQIRGDTDGQKEASEAVSHLYQQLDCLRRSAWHSRPSVRPLLVQLLDHGNRFVRNVAATALLDIRQADLVPKIIRVLGEDGGDQVFIHPDLIDSEGFGSTLPGAEIIAIVDDPTAGRNTRWHAIQCLGYTRDENGLNALIPLMHEPEFAHAAIYAVGRIGGPRATAELLQLLQTDTSALDKNLVLSIVMALGHTRDQAAFPTLAGFDLQGTSDLPYVLPEALAATGGELAISSLREIWLSHTSARQQVLQSLLWLATPAAIDAILDLVDLDDPGDLRLLISAASHGPYLTLFGGRPGDPVDARIASALVERFDRLQSSEQELILRVAAHSATPQGLALLERVGTDPAWEIDVVGSISSQPRTLRSVALHELLVLGSPTALDLALEPLGEARLGPAAASYWLEKMPRDAVENELRSRLSRAQPAELPGLLTLLGWFGGPEASADVRPYLSDADPSIYDAAYEAERRLLGLL